METESKRKCSEINVSVTVNGDLSIYSSFILPSISFYSFGVSAFSLTWKNEKFTLPYARRSIKLG